MLLGLQSSVRPLARAPVRAQAQRSSRRAVRVCAAQQQETEVDENIVAYCSLDKGGKRPSRELSLQEKEELFIGAMTAYYYNQELELSNEEFDNLKEELTWEGSKVVALSADEKRLLEARLAYSQGRPIMSDADYNALKDRLKDSSIFIIDDAPACSLGNAPGKRGQKLGPAEADFGKMAALNLPPVLLVLGALGGLELVPGVDLLGLLRLPEPYGILLIGGVLLPSVYVAANAIANLLFKDALILKASCPNCGEVNSSYFGDILTVQGSREKNTVKCPCCESTLEFDAQRREVVVAETAF